MAVTSRAREQAFWCVPQCVQRPVGMAGMIASASTRRRGRASRGRARARGPMPPKHWKVFPRERTRADHQLAVLELAGLPGVNERDLAEPLSTAAAGGASTASARRSSRASSPGGGGPPAREREEERDGDESPGGRV